MGFILRIIQRDSLSMFAFIFSFDSEFVKIMIFGIFKYTRRVLELFVLLKECPVAIQTSAYKNIPPSLFYYCKLFSG